MAKQVGLIKITGTIEDLCFYKLDGQYYLRMKSSLKGSRVKKDPAFRVTMQYASRLAEASRLASALYREFPAEKKGIKVFRKIVGDIMRLLEKEKL